MAPGHLPVLLEETIEAFRPVAESSKAVTIVDGTLGGAGHTAALLRRYPSARVLACDTDPAAIESARARLEPAEGRVAFFHGDFSALVDPSPLDRATGAPPAFGPPWDGVLLDLGYSSIQLEDPTYGMSFQVEGPLDMRLSRQGETAWELVRSSSSEELGEILRVYGEIPGAARLARRIKVAVGTGEITNSTLSLARFLERISGPRRSRKIHPATLVFQALRIAVNDELRKLDHFLEGVILKLKSPAVVAVITFHSLEDRIVKNWGRKHPSELRAATKKPLTAGREETAANPRARSAKLRVYHY